MSDKIRINFIYRNIKSGFFSIHKVFRPIENDLPAESRHLETPTFHAGPFDVLRNLLWMFAHRDRKAIHHITGVMHYLTLALIGCPTVLTIHDLSIINSHNKLKRLFFRFFWYSLPLRITPCITCISEKTRQELLTEFKGLAANKISVIYNPLDPIFKYSPKPFNDKTPVILQIGTTANKNLKRVCQALKGIPCHLVIIGKLSSDEINDLEEKNISYTNKVGLTDEEILLEYQSADIVSFPSLYEGFGMPIIEGQATGRVVLTSDIAPMTEIGADAVCYVNPYDADDIRRGFCKLINDKSYREKLIAKGLENVVRFDVSAITASYLQLYQKLLKNRKR